MSVESAGQIRRIIKQKRQDFSKTPSFIQDSETAGNNIEIIIRGMDNIRSVLCFYPIRDEIRLMGLYERLLGDYELYFPVTGEVSLLFYRVDDLADSSFSPGKMGVLEPCDRSVEFKAPEAQSSIAIVPGLAFSPVSMGRIGYGKGYYDRFLAAFYGIYTIGAGFEFQLVDELPIEKWDIPLNMIVTEHGIYGK